MEHKGHAEFLKEEIIAIYEENVEVFAFSDPIHIGQVWYNNLIDNIKEANVALVLLSPSSVNRPWLLFESGAAVALGIKIIPLRFSGLQDDILPGPLAIVQSCDLCQREDVIQMLSNISICTQPPQKTILLKTARSIVDYFRRVEREQVETVIKERPLQSINYRIALLSKSSDTQRKLFLHVRTWEDWENKKGVLESDIRKGMPILYDRHKKEGRKRDLIISPSEYYFRLRELYHLGLLEMEKISDFENRWSINPEVRELLR